MANYWAIAIGINQYHLFQPLQCAQADAEALNDFLIQDAGFAPQRCLLMTDSSRPIDDRSTYPTKENILLLLEDLAAVCWQPQDHVWLFFSGYGVNYEGRDYLMPVEADPKQVAETGIELRSLMQSLQLADLNVLLLLDINRAFGTQGDNPVGQETIELAQELQLATILSCQTEQFSHESSELGHGFFTAALLQALRSDHGSSLAALENYLGSFTPELCQHYWRPTQNPIAVIPFSEQAILPQMAATHHEAVPSTLEPHEVIPTTLEPGEIEPFIFPEESFAMAIAAPSLEAKTPRITTGEWGEALGVETSLNGKYQEAKSPNFSSNQPDLDIDVDAKEEHFSQPPQEPDAGRFIPNTPQPHISRIPPNKSDAALWQQFILWGGGTLLVVTLISVVILRNQVKVLKMRQMSPTASPTAPIDPKIINSLPTPSSVSNVSALTPPQNQSTAQIAPNFESQKRNQAVLDLAKKSLRQTQASDLSLAIATARKIKPGEPLYEQAQENIKIWSRMILDLAEGRAKQKQYTNAIAAAQLITKGESLYPQAQAAINQWKLEAKQYLGNKTLLDAANAIIKPGQASTYNRAIEVAKRVPSGQPGFDLAQKSINKWSETILDLAKIRADQGDLKAAIAAATLIPQVTPVYEDAQEAIQKWQGKKGQ